MLTRRLLERIQDTRRLRDEAGIAMMVAIMVVFLMTLIPLAIFSQAVQQLPLARHDQDHEMALAAAEAGVDDYLNHLAQNQNYWTYNASNLPPAPDTNSASAIDPNGTPIPGGAFKNWVSVPGPNASNEQFWYKVDTTQTASTGVVYITSTGRSRSVKRSVKIGLRRQGFLDYLWLTDYEITDPVLSGASASNCKFHAWEWNSSNRVYGPSSPSSCSVVTWTDQALLNGPVHSNDGLYVCGGPTVNGNTDTYYNAPTSGNVANSLKFAGPGKFLNGPGCSVTNNPHWSRTGDPASGSLLAFPPANTAIKSQADGTQGGTGCLFTGNTTITLNVGGTMTVSSPSTKSTNSGCGTPGGCLKTSSCTVNLPSNGVIYVQNVPTSGSDPNKGSCSGTACNGDVKLSGVLKGQLTIASQNDIIITGDVTYKTPPPGGTDVLGLAANNNVTVYHPVDSRGNNAAGTNTNVTIDAAILALNHSFYVQNWSSGALLGTLTVNGVIAQEYRGPVGTFDPSTGTGSTGYSKNYNYDTRLKYLSPPYFLSPTQSSWGRISYSEISAVAGP